MFIDFGKASNAPPQSSVNAGHDGIRRFRTNHRPSIFIQEDGLPSAPTSEVCNQQESRALHESNQLFIFSFVDIVSVPYTSENSSNYISVSVAAVGIGCNSIVTHDRHFRQEHNVPRKKCLCPPQYGTGNNWPQREHPSLVIPRPLSKHMAQCTPTPSD